MIDALKTAEGAVPGKPVEVNMGKDDGKVVYKIEIIDAAKKRATFTLMRSRGKFIPSSNSHSTERPPSGGRSLWDPFIMSYLMWLLIGSLVGLLHGCATAQKAAQPLPAGVVNKHRIDHVIIIAIDGLKQDTLQTYLQRADGKRRAGCTISSEYNATGPAS